VRNPKCLGRCLCIWKKKGNRVKKSQDGYLTKRGMGQGEAKNSRLDNVTWRNVFFYGESNPWTGAGFQVNGTPSRHPGIENTKMCVWDKRRGESRISRRIIYDKRKGRGTIKKKSPACCESWSRVELKRRFIV